MIPKSMDESRTERKKRKTREKIIRVAVDLFQEQGFNSTTMEQIAARADVARKTLYNHFPVKDAIIDEYVKAISSRLARESLETIRNLPDTRSRLLAALKNAYGWVEINPEFTGICLSYRMKNMFQTGEKNKDTGTQAILYEIIMQGQQEGEIRRDISERLLVANIDFLRGAVVLEWLNDTSRFDLHKEMAKLVDLFLYGANRS